VIAHVTVTKSHDHMSQWDVVKDSKNNDVIIACYIYVLYIFL